MSVEPRIDTAPKVSDEIKQTTCYMCACRCGTGNGREGHVDDAFASIGSIVECAALE